MRHLIGFGGLTRAEWESLYQRCGDITDHPAGFMDACRGRVIAGLSYEPSTRTNSSFQTIMLQVGGTMFGFVDPKSTPIAEGEILKDTIKMVSGYADVVVMRDPKENAAEAASLYFDVPVINAGDGDHMHPTQTTVNLTAITRLWDKVGGLSVGLCGDLENGRTVHSFIKALAKSEGIKLSFITPHEPAIPEYIRAFMRKHGMWFTEVIGLETVIPQLNVLYMTHIQWKRFVDPLEYERRKGIYILTRQKLDQAKKELLVIHPPPQVDEIAIDVNDDFRAVYLEQAHYGMYVRMALFADLANQEREKPESVGIDVKPMCSSSNCIIQTEHCLPPLVKRNGGVGCCAYCDKELQQRGK